MQEETFKKKILVIDDEANVRKLCHNLLTKRGYHVTTMPSGYEIFTMIKNYKPDLMVMDLHVPGEEGLSLLRRMPKQEERRIPVIIYSGMVTPDIQKKALGEGAVDVISKSLGTQQLMESIEKNISVSFETPCPAEIEPPRSRIVVVDDDASVRQLLVRFLKKTGYEIHTAESGEQAIEVIEQIRPSLVLLDVTMPGIDGILTLRTLHKKYPHLGVVMITGLHDETLAQEAIRLGAYDYVLKPFDLEHLKMVLATYFSLAA